MTQCKYFQNCPVNFETNQTFEKPMSINEYFLHKFCEDKASDCARFQVKEEIGEKNVPEDLLPYEHERAEKIINNYR